MYLKQTITFNGHEMSNTCKSGIIFGQLMLAQEWGFQLHPDIGPCWLQERHNFMELLNKLHNTGKMWIYDTPNQIQAEIKWEWISPTPSTSVEAQPQRGESPSAQDLAEAIVDFEEGLQPEWDGKI